MSLGSTELVAVADLSEERLAHVNEHYPTLNTTHEFSDFFDMDIDAVAIATPPSTHHFIAKACLEQGLHCLIEKPLTSKVSDATELIDIAESNDVRLMVGHTFEYSPAVREIRRIIDSGELGEIYYIDSVRANLGLFQLNTDAMWDLAPHDISIVNYLLQAQPDTVLAHGGSFILKEHNQHDVVYLHIEYPGKKLANIRVSWLDPNKTRRTTVVGSQKMLVYDDIENLEKIRIYDKGLEEVPYTNTYGEFQCSYRYGGVSIPSISWEEPLQVECRHFAESIQSGTAPISDGHSGLRVVEVLEAAEKSLQLGQAVKIEALDISDQSAEDYAADLKLQANEPQANAKFNPVIVNE